jgi:hypothetical protein
MTSEPAWQPRERPVPLRRFAARAPKASSELNAERRPEEAPACEASWSSGLELPKHP